jgi:addiction module RelE/StbE family toxin
VWTRLASQDRAQIRDYIAQDNVAAALSLDEQISENAHRLIEQPGIGRPGRVTGTREWVVHKNYVLVYDTTGDAVRILRLLHAARRWPA